jgi:hypothetical protein
MTTFVFIDESGEPGFQDSSPTSHFILSLLIFDSAQNLKECEEKLLHLKQKLKFKTEFKFVKSYDKVRDEFFETIKDLNFRVRAVCVEKVRIENPFLRNNPKEFYNFFLKKLIINTYNLNDIYIMIDGKASKYLALEVKTYLRQNSSLKIKKLKFECSKKNILIQMSDMIASAVGYSYNRRDRKDSQKWKNIIKKKLDIWEFAPTPPSSDRR